MKKNPPFSLYLQNLKPISSTVLSLTLISIFSPDGIIENPHASSIQKSATKKLKTNHLT